MSGEDKRLTSTDAGHVFAVKTSGWEPNDPNSVGIIEFECGFPGCMRVDMTVLPSTKIPLLVASIVGVHEEAMQ